MSNHDDDYFTNGIADQEAASEMFAMKFRLAQDATRTRSWDEAAVRYLEIIAALLYGPAKANALVAAHKRTSRVNASKPTGQ